MIGSALILLPTTLTPKISFLTVAVRLALGALGLHLFSCTLLHWRRLRIRVLLIHLGVTIVLLGGLASTFGYVATVNVHEGASTAVAYRWDLEQDAPLGVDLVVERINREYYPVPVKVGVLQGGARAGLFTVSTGEDFSVAGFRVRLTSLDPLTKSAALEIYDDNGAIGTANTAGDRNLPPDFPLDFKLVAFQEPALKRIWLDLRLAQGGVTITRGTSEVNQPFVWEKIRYYNTKADWDQYGNPYAGIQIVHDPGVTWVYGGFAVMTLGGLLYLVGFGRSVRR
jgi:hypothetical protein